MIEPVRLWPERTMPRNSAKTCLGSRACPLPHPLVDERPWCDHSGACVPTSPRLTDENSTDGSMVVADRRAHGQDASAISLPIPHKPSVDTAPLLQTCLVETYGRTLLLIPVAFRGPWWGFSRVPAGD